MRLFPAQLKIKDGNRLHILWEDGSVSDISLNLLRSKCPCAICNEERDSRSKTYIPLFTGDQLKISNMSIIGHYAVGVVWKDGHSTGIYEFEYLKDLGREGKTRQ
jgi:DUF971 family protein